MNLFGLFQSREEKERLSHIKNLIAMTLADGRIDKNELATIAAVASREGVSAKTVKDLLENPEKAKLVVPNSDSRKVQYLKDLVLLMMSDGNIDDEEFALCKLIAVKYGYRHEVIDAMILDIIADLTKAMQG